MIYEYDDAPWYDDSCDDHQNAFSPEQTVGMAYVPMQVWSKPMCLEEGFYRGTVFQDLDKPFQP